MLVVLWLGSKGLSALGKFAIGSVWQGSRGLASDGLVCFVGVCIGSSGLVMHVGDGRGMSRLVAVRQFRFVTHRIVSLG